MVPKFRGKRKDNGEWVVGVPVPNSFCNVVHMIPILLTDKVAYPPERLYEYLIEIEPETLGQSTGLKDKNGVEISEGDVVSLTEGECSYSGIVVRDYYEFYIKGIGPRDCFDFQDVSNTFDGTTSLEVTTNIYKNPELLEQANEN